MLAALIAQLFPFAEDNLPDRYIMLYPDGFSIFMINRRIKELRFHRPGYTFRGKLRVGSTLEEVLKVLGPPTETVSGRKNTFKDGVLYKDIDGRKGHCYYARCDKGVRMFFLDNKVNALYVTRTSPE